MLNRKIPITVDPCTLCQRVEGPASQHCRPLNLGAYYCSMAGRVDTADSMMTPTPDPISVIIDNDPDVIAAQDAQTAAEAAYNDASALRDSLMAEAQRSGFTAPGLHRIVAADSGVASGLVRVVLSQNMDRKTRGKADALREQITEAHDAVELAALALGKARVKYQQTARFVSDSHRLTKVTITND